MEFLRVLAGAPARAKSASVTGAPFTAKSDGTIFCIKGGASCDDALNAAKAGLTRAWNHCAVLPELYDTGVDIDGLHQATNTLELDAIFLTGDDVAHILLHNNHLLKVEAALISSDTFMPQASAIVLPGSETGVIGLLAPTYVLVFDEGLVPPMLSDLVPLSRIPLGATPGAKTHVARRLSEVRSNAKRLSQSTLKDTRVAYHVPTRKIVFVDHPAWRSRFSDEDFPDSLEDVTKISDATSHVTPRELLDEVEKSELFVGAPSTLEAALAAKPAADKVYVYRAGAGTVAYTAGSPNDVPVVTQMLQSDGKYYWKSLGRGATRRWLEAERKLDAPGIISIPIVIVTSNMNYLATPDYGKLGYVHPSSFATADTDAQRLAKASNEERESLRHTLERMAERGVAHMDAHSRNFLYKPGEHYMVVIDWDD
jgi:hypothetical protein